MSFAFQVCAQMSSTVRGGDTGREKQVTFSHCSILRGQCLSVVVFIGRRRVTRQRVQSLKLFIVSRDKQPLRVIHAALRCTISLVEHFLTHSWLPPSYYDSETQGEKKFQTSEHSSACVCVCAGVRDIELMQAVSACIYKIM